jgi:hypothetical protein
MSDEKKLIDDGIIEMQNKGQAYENILMCSMVQWTLRTDCSCHIRSSPGHVAFELPALLTNLTCVCMYVCVCV